MSTTSTFNRNMTTDVVERQPHTGLFDKAIDARMRKGAAYVAAYLKRQSDESLANLGFKPHEITQIRATGQIPASFWR